MDSKPIPLDALTPAERTVLIGIATRFGVPNLRAFRLHGDAPGNVILRFPRNDDKGPNGGTKPLIT